MANDKKFSDSATWLGEGLAEYISGLVASRLSPRQAWKRERETLPEVSLNSNEVREGLLRWSYKPETLNLESVLYYGAANQMLRLVIAESERLGEKEPLQKLLAAIRRQTRPLDSVGVVTLLKEELNVDVTKLGVLDPMRKKEIFDAAKSTYLRERYNKKTGYRYNSLNTFAYLDENLPEEILTALVEEVLDEKNDPLFRRLSAKSLLSRVDQAVFDRLRSSDSLGGRKLKKYDSLDAFRKYLSSRVDKR